MKIIDDKIVFSEDIKMIMDGKNALDFSYQDKGIVLPEESFYEDIRQDFYEETMKIFDGNVSVLSEEEMYEGIHSVVSDVFGRYPHYIFR